MIEEARVPETPSSEQSVAPKQEVKARRKIINFTGENPVAINLDHVCIMRAEGKTVYFDFYTKTQPVDMVDEASAKAILQEIMNIWAD